MLRCNRHHNVLVDLPLASPRLQQYVAELVMIRLFDEFQEALAGIATRLVCGASYLDGSQPSPILSVHSTSAAQTLMKTYGRSRPTELRWSKATFINGNTQFVLPGAEYFTTVVSANGTIIAEMQAVRNRIAHKNTNSMNAFMTVVARRYGARRPNVSPGLLLLTPRFTPTLLEQYLLATQIIARSCVRA